MSGTVTAGGDGATMLGVGTGSAGTDGSEGVTGKEGRGPASGADTPRSGVVVTDGCEPTLAVGGGVEASCVAGGATAPVGCANSGRILGTPARLCPAVCPSRTGLRFDTQGVSPTALEEEPSRECL